MINPYQAHCLYDITRPLAGTTACWPGDVPFSFDLGWRIRDGASCNVGAIQTSVHNGTHCDAPFHFLETGATVDRLRVETFLGPAWVVDVRATPGRWRERLEGLDFQETPRVLFRTGGWTDTQHFPDRIPVMESDLPDWLSRHGIGLVGVDVPSVDALDSRTLDNHHALGRQGIVFVEGLWLEEVPEGRYELIALPLKIVGADGSPVRALLRGLPDRAPRVTVKAEQAQAFPNEADITEPLH